MAATHSAKHLHLCSDCVYTHQLADSLHSVIMERQFFYAWLFMRNAYKMSDEGLAGHR